MNNYPQYVNAWELYSGSAKIVVSVKSEEELIELSKKAQENNLPYCVIKDAGRTQVAPGSITVCAIGPGKVDEVDKVTGHLSLL